MLLLNQLSSKWTAKVIFNSKYQDVSCKKRRKTSQRSIFGPWILLKHYWPGIWSTGGNYPGNPGQTPTIYGYLKSFCNKHVFLRDLNTITDLLHLFLPFRIWPVQKKMRSSKYGRGWGIIPGQGTCTGRHRPLQTVTAVSFHGRSIS